MTTNFLSQVASNTDQEGQRIVIAAVEGSGKTTLAANAPRALLIPTENGYTAIKTPKTPLIQTWPDMLGLMDEIRLDVQRKRNEYKTLSFDSATGLERLIHEEVLNSDMEGKKKLGRNHNMETAWGAYGKAYSVANNYFGSFLGRCDELARHAKINIVITSHVFSSIVKDAAYGEYSTWDLLLHSPKNDKTYGKREMLTQWPDLVGFLHQPLFVSTEVGKMARGIDAGQGRQLAVDRTPGWVAKNRYGLKGLITIPDPNLYIAANKPYDGWNYLAHQIYTNSGIDIYNRDV